MVEFTGQLTTSGGVGSQALLSAYPTIFDIRSRYKTGTTGNYGQITRYAVIEATKTTQTGSAPYYGFIYRDLPTGTSVQQRILAPNQSVFLHKTGSIGNVGTNLTALYIKLRYKIYDGATF